MAVWSQVTDVVAGLLVKSPIITVGVIGVLVYWLYLRYKGKHPYCLVRVKEKRGNQLVDHLQLYKGFIHKIIDEESKKEITWLEIKGKKFQHYWKIPKGEELVPTMSGMRLVELVWQGGNSFAVLKADNYMYEEINTQVYKKTPQGIKTVKEKLFKKSEADLYRLGVLPDDLKMIDYQMSSEIPRLMRSNTWDEVLKKAAPYFIVGLICLLMIWVTVDKSTSVLGDKVGDLGKKITTLTEVIQGRSTTQTDENTVKSPGTPGGG